MSSFGVISYAANGGWSFLLEAFDGTGCSPETYTPLVTEKLRPRQASVFAEFLSASHEEATAMARRRVKTSSLLVSVGMGLGDQVRALRYRSVVNSLLTHGWDAVIACVANGVGANHVLHDPVFPVHHPRVLDSVAEKLATDASDSTNHKSLAVLERFFGRLLNSSTRALSATTSKPLVLFLYDKAGPRRLHDSARTLLLAAIWSRRRDEFDEVCENVGIARNNAVYEVFLQGCEGALAELVSIPDESLRFQAFCHAFHSGADQNAYAIASSIPQGSFQNCIALRLVHRVAKLEKIIVGAIMERSFAAPQNI